MICLLLFIPFFFLLFIIATTTRFIKKGGGHGLAQLSQNKTRSRFGLAFPNKSSLALLNAAAYELLASSVI
jgi:hypothetical protein